MREIDKGRKVEHDAESDAKLVSTSSVSDEIGSSRKHFKADDERARRAVGGLREHTLLQRRVDHQMASGNDGRFALSTIGAFIRPFMRGYFAAITHGRGDDNGAL